MLNLSWLFEAHQSTGRDVLNERPGHLLIVELVLLSAVTVLILLLQVHSLNINICIIHYIIVKNNQSF